MEIINKLLFNDSSLIVYAILGWWFNKQYDRYIEDLIESAIIKEKAHLNKFTLYQHDTSGIRTYVNNLLDEWKNIPDKNSQQAKDKYNEYLSWVFPIKITKNEARNEFNWAKFILCYAIPIIPVIKIFIDKIMNGFCLKSYISDIWK
jgi:hypothetical protein